MADQHPTHSNLTALRVYEPDECGKDRYPLAWHSIDGGPGVKHIVRELAGHRCVRCLHPYVCGVSNAEWSPCDEDCRHRGPYRYEWNDIWEDVDAGDHVNTAGQVKRLIGLRAIEAKRRVLTVHHLRLGHDAKRDLRWWNLTALCQRCHLQIQGKVQMERVWPHEHTEWFKPYAAGWYAWSYLGLELTRDEAEARMDELLALELAA